MLYAVVDIETTGSHAGANGITEIAIAIHDGTRILDFFESLVNPQMPIQYFVQRLTGIDERMVSKAPVFNEIAGKIYELLHDKVFVAHNVNFDYSFVKHQLLQCGYDLDTPKLCSIRLARKIFPNLAAYGLSKITQILGINHSQRHRAGGDALATADLLALLVKNDLGNEIEIMLKGNNPEQYIPPHLPVDQIASLPSETGVYYFYNAKGKVIYVGKAKNIRKRVKSHFSNNKTGKQKQDFLRDTFRVTYKLCATELIAHIVESMEIRKLWPLYNRSQKGYLAQFGLFTYDDMGGYKRLMIGKNKNSVKPLYSFNTIIEGSRRLKELVKEFGLCPHLCNLDKIDNIHNVHNNSDADCGCEYHAEPITYNARVDDAINWLHKHLPTFVLLDKGINDNGYSCVLVNKGVLSGIGHITDKKKQLADMEQLIQQLEPVHDSDYIRNLVLRHAVDFPEKCFMFK